MTNPPKKPPGSGQVQIQVPGNLEPAYTNFAVIRNSPSEIVIDFAQIMPQLPQARVKARVVMTPTNAKLLHRALNEHLQRYETQYGEIMLPEGPSLADQLFRAPDSDGE
jgi:hypothetical protein